jgi:hypothetical protein
VFKKRNPNPYRNLVEATERDVRLVLVGGTPYYGDLPFMQTLKGQDYEAITVQGVQKAIDVTDPAFPLGGETLAEIQGKLAKALLADPTLLHQEFGSSMDDSEFESYLNKKFPGLHAVALDALLPDESFFSTIRNSPNAQLGFDIATYWKQGAGPGESDPDALMLNLVNAAGSTLEVLDKEVGLNKKAAQAIVLHRNGQDGTLGTQDDRLFKTVAELDLVPYVGNSTLTLLRNFASAHPQ